MKIATMLKKLFRREAVPVFTPDAAQQAAALRIRLLEDALKGMVQMARTEVAHGRGYWKRAADVAEAVANGQPTPEPEIPSGWRTL